MTPRTPQPSHVGPAVARQTLDRLESAILGPDPAAEINALHRNPWNDDNPSVPGVAEPPD